MNSIYVIGDALLAKCYEKAKIDSKCLNFANQNVQCVWETDIQQTKAVEEKYKDLFSKNGKPDVVVILCGSYDLLLNKNPKDVSEEMLKLTQHILSTGVKYIVVCSIIDRYEDKVPCEVNRFVKFANRMLAKRFKKNEQIYFLHIRPRGKSNDLWDSDHSNLKPEGYSHIYERIKTAIHKSLVTNLQPVAELAVPLVSASECTVPPIHATEYTVPPTSGAECTIPPTSGAECTVPPSSAAECTVPPISAAEFTVQPTSTAECTKKNATEDSDKPVATIMLTDPVAEYTVPLIPAAEYTIPPIPDAEYTVPPTSAAECTNMNITEDSVKPVATTMVTDPVAESTVSPPPGAEYTVSPTPAAEYTVPPTSAECTKLNITEDSVKPVATTMVTDPVTESTVSPPPVPPTPAAEYTVPPILAAEYTVPPTSAAECTKMNLTEDSVKPVATIKLTDGVPIAKRMMEFNDGLKTDYKRFCGEDKQLTTECNEIQRKLEETEQHKKDIEPTYEKLFNSQISST